MSPSCTFCVLNQIRAFFFYYCTKPNEQNYQMDLYHENQAVKNCAVKQVSNLKQVPKLLQFLVTTETKELFLLFLF